MYDEAEKQLDIFEAIKKKLAEIKKLAPTKSVWKRMMHYTAMAEYVKLREQLVREGKAKRPFERAASIVATRMGKKAYFARQVRRNTNYFYKNGRLPSFQSKRRGGKLSLLDNNEAVALAVRRYLALQQIGEISPDALRRHLINEIFPSLSSENVDNIPQTIATRTMQRWLHKLGFLRSRAKKGVYVDGHNRPDVIKARKNFLDRLKELEV